MSGFLLAFVWALAIFPGPAKDKPPTLYSLPLPPKPDYSTVDWLIGEWSGKSVAPSPIGEAHLSVAYDLDKRIVVFKEAVDLTAAGNVPAMHEQWMGILSPDAGGRGLVLRVFSSTGFVTRYRADLENAVIHFYPAGGEVSPSGWLFRRTLTRSSETAFTETVQAAPPDKPFFDYYTFQFTRVTPPAPAAPAVPDSKP
ncbi:MAG: hypothetical protein DMG21_19705 [Acidobacteria bacterium]|nr:MAG: hypothetical protein DMG21_19705 [Acidobacteriota bacterium]